MNENKEIMAKNIKRYMGILDLTATEICKDLGIKQNTFSDWVNAKTYPRIDKIEMMANYFGVSKADLVEAPGSSRPPQPRPKVSIRQINSEGVSAIGPFLNVSDLEYTVLQKYREADEVEKEMVHRALKIEVTVKKKRKYVSHKSDPFRSDMKQLHKQVKEAMQQSQQSLNKAQMGFVRKTVKRRDKNGIS